ncbi:TonB-dependent receptor [Pseudomaricurvus alkylphenolicus]|uniref:TonB-dependent receptor n=1 Tax=Pseudomaricurvus alkylphenolicus TaxID=1306991 RepID=UPI00141F9B28|nr:TonB-dependent receptor [Pseudomaricurvus alkylphenolicus]NIB44155.1 TonB-dependent receptor [Pseudomaricurvus alkylphenolicus]
MTTQEHLLIKNGVRRGTLAAAVLATTLTGGTSVVAQELALEEVIVTAQKRAQSLQDVPASVSAISAESSRDFLGSGENIRALAGRVPSLQIESSNGRQSPRFYIRGLGNTDFDVNANQPVSMVMDDIALENAILKAIPMYDVQQIEVLRGPQGTLFGRNTPAGIVKIDTVRPTFETEGYLQASYGERGNRSFEGAIGGGLSESVAARFSFKYLGRDDWIDNNADGSEIGGFDEYAYRLQVLAKPSENLTALVKLHAFKQDGDTPQPFYANALEVGKEGVRSGFDPEDLTQDSTTDGEIDHAGGALTLTYDAEDYTIVSITGYDTLDSFSRGDIDGGIIGGPENIGQLGFNAFFGVATGDGLSDHYQFNQELRISSQQDNWFYQAGLFYFKEDLTVDNVDFDPSSNAQTAITFTEQETTSAAIFGQVEYSLSEDLKVTAGLRYTEDDKELDVVPGTGSFALPASIEKDDSYVNWDLALTYDMNEDWTLFGRAGNASRGPVTIGRFGFTSEADTETLTSIEFGFKATLLDGRARWNTTVYRYEIEDQQLTATGGEANTNSLLNADETVGQGLETDLEILVSENFRINANLSYNDSEIRDSSLRDDLCGSTPQCTGKDPVVGTRDGFFGEVTEVSIDGNPLPRAPEWIANINLWYGVDIDAGQLYASTDWNYRSDSNIFYHESVEFVADSRWIGGVRLGYKNPEGNLDVALVGRNVTDEIAVDGALNFLNLTAFVNEPRYWGAEVRYEFD